MYIVPTPADLPGGWRLRYTGLSLNHQSNGQTLPLSRSWNRTILMAGMEKGERFTLTGRLWNRDHRWRRHRRQPGYRRPDRSRRNHRQLAGQQGQHADVDPAPLLTADANGSYRLEWLQALGDDSGSGKPSGLRLHIQLFNGYGDSLVDYNRGRTVLSVGLSLVDW